MSGEDENQTVLSLREESSLTVREIVVPYAQKNVIETKLPNNCFFLIETTSPFRESLSIMKTDVVNML